MALNQDNSPLRINTPLGKDVLGLTRFQGGEGLSELFCYRLDLVSEDADIKLENLLGKPVDIEVDLYDYVGNQIGTRYLHGHVTEFAQSEYVGSRYVAYRATVRPALWFLTRSANCRIFADQKVPDIIKQIVADSGLAFKLQLNSGQYKVREYCVQYRESDFAFLSRLMEQEGIYYYFSQEKGKHTLVLCDAPGDHSAAEHAASLDYQQDFVEGLSVAKEVQTGKYSLRDFDFKQPGKPPEATERPKVTRSHEKADLEVYDFPSGIYYPDESVAKDIVSHFAQVRLEALQARHDLVRATVTWPVGLYAGCKFALTDCPRGDQDRDYLLVNASYDIHSYEYDTGAADKAAKGKSGDGGADDWFKVELLAMDAKEQFRAPCITPKPVVHGPHTALVTQGAEDTDPDKHGRIKVKFHWARKDEDSCWLRVAQFWAGDQWGAQFLPRNGHEVMVEFLEGDPDRPIVTGRVYNGENKHPYTLGDNWTQSGIKTACTNGGSNELRFEDKGGAEEVYMHAERDFLREVDNDDTLKVGLEKKSPGNQTIDIHNDQSVTLQQGNQTVTLKMGNHTLDIKAGKSLTQAMQSITLKVGGSSIKIDPSGITLKAPMITIQSDAKTEVKSSGIVMVQGSLVKIN